MSDLSGITFALVVLVWLAIALFIFAGFWKIFTKAGFPGWLSLIPIVNGYFMFRIGGKPGWWLILAMIPLVNVVVAIMAQHGISENFGKGVGTTLGLIFLPFVFYPMLGFGSAQHNGNIGP